jgi:Spy/CpxP family protein refolding chaperone
MRTAIKTFVVGMCLLIGLSAAAQNQEDRAAKMAKRQTERLTQKLTLSDDQSIKVEVIMLDFNKKYIADIKADSVRKAPNPLLVEKRNADLKQVLTPEQYETFSKMELAKGTFGPMQHRRGGNHGEHHGDHPVE